MTRTLWSLLVVVLATLALTRDSVAEDAVTREMVREELEAYRAESKNDIRAYWGNTLKLEAFGGKFSAAFGGRLQADFTFFGGDDEALEEAIDDEFESGFQFRRLWVHVAGKITNYAKYMLQVGYVGTANRVVVLDAWVQLTGLDKCIGCWVPDIRIGHTQEPIGLAWMTSSKYFTMTGWPIPTTSFTPGYNSGVTLLRGFYGDRVTTRIGYFGANSGVEGRYDWEDGQAVTGRITMLPWAPCGKSCRLLHIGVGGSYRWDLSTTRFRSRPDIDLGPFVVDTGVLDASTEIFIDLEAALVYDHFTVQGEYMWVQVDADAGTDPEYWGWYAQASYIFGAPCRNYARGSGAFVAPKVKNPFDCKERCAMGAWEVALRYSYVDLDDGDKRGGRCGDIVAGVNWWLNPNAKLMMNYVHGEVRGALGERFASPGDGSVDAVVVRFQVHW